VINHQFSVDDGAFRAYLFLHGRSRATKGKKMSIVQNKDAFVDPAAVSIDISQIFSETASNSNPTYLVLTVLDRNEYTAGATGATGSLTGNGHTLNLSSIGGDGRGTGIVFTYQASTGRYYSSTYGYFDQLIYNSSGSLDDVTNLSLFGTNNLSQATSYATNAYNMMQADPSGYLGSATVATEPSFAGTVPVQATPDSIAAVADTFVGKAWNMDGCWVLASTISAEAGASLPVQSTLIGLPGQTNGEWIVAFNGPSGQSGNWQSLVHEGEVIVIGTPGGGGHITTCVSGSGATAMLVDNVTYVNGNGQVTNLAGDGDSSDIVVSAPHLASQEWAGVSASSVVIYELDTPVVACSVSSDNLAFHATQSLGSLFTATDPANKTITEWQVYDTAASDMLVLNGTDYNDHSAASALTVTSLGLVSLLTGSTATTDTLEVEAYNGTYWGDWQSLSVSVTATAPKAPVLETQTSNQTWTGGTAISLALPGSTFADPQNETLTYSAELSSGQALPAWLVFNAATDTFSGTAPTAAQTLKITVTATDTSKLSVSDTFSATVLGLPTVTAQTPNQTWTEGAAVSLVLPTNTFTDPQGQSLSYTATLSNGQALPGWLTFNAKTETFSGTAPATAQSLNIKVTATDTSGLTASESFTAAVAAPAPPAPPAPPKPGIAVTDQTPNQTWIDGQAVALVLPSNTFTDALGLKMAFAAYEVNGPNVTSWLRFDPTKDELFGTVPATATGTVELAVVATDTLHLAAIDFFNVTLAASSSHVLGVSISSVSPFAAPSMMGSFALHT
jgi:Putative Ig domain